MDRPYIVCHMTVSIDGKPLFADGAVHRFELKQVEDHGGILVTRYQARETI